MHKLFKYKAYEQEYGPHFNLEESHKAVNKMQNEDGSRGPHWSIEETTSLANQYNVNLRDRFNKYDWFVALNMIYSDYYKVIVNISNSNNAKHFVEFAKAWLNDKDVDEGKMWYYYIYVICDKIREEETEYFEEKSRGYEDEDFGRFRMGNYRSGRMSIYKDNHKRYRDDYEDDYDYEDRDRNYNKPSVRYVRY